MNLHKRLVLLFLILALNGTLFAQTSLFDKIISIDSKDQTIEKTLELLHKKYPDINFSYSSELLKANNKVSLNFNNVKLREVLNQLFHDNEIEYLLVNDNIALRQRSKQPTPISTKPKKDKKSTTNTKTSSRKSATLVKDSNGDYFVTGKVVDEDGGSLPGASVIIKGTVLGVITNVDGKYRFNLKNHENATLLFRFIGKKEVEVPLKGKTVINVVLPNSSEALDEIVFIGYGSQRKRDIVGAIASVKAEELTVAVPTSIDQMLEGKVAGLTVQSSSSAPGAKTEVRVRGVSSIDAVNTPLYIIDGVPYTTEIEMELFDGFSMNPLANINAEDIESISVLKDAAATSIYGANASNGVILINTKKGRKGKAKLKFTAKTGFSNRVNNSYERLNTAEYIELMTEALINNGATPEEAAIKAGRTDVDVDWPGMLYRTGINQNYNLSASGGSENFNYYTSMGYSGQQGIVLGNEMNKTSLRINLGHKIGDNVKVSYNLSPTYIYKENFVLLEEANELLPNIPIYDENGDYNSAIKEHPIAILNQNEDFDKSYRMVGSINATINFLKKFSGDVKYGFDLYNNSSRTHYSMLNQTGATYGGMGSRVSTQNLSWYINGMVTYKNTIRENHHIDWLISSEANKSEVNTISARASNFPNDNMRELSSGSVYEYAGSRRSINTRVSYFSRLNYNFKNRYYFTGSIRNDASSIFGGDVKSSNKGAVGLSWMISSEPFFTLEKQKLEFLKIRASFGTAGNSRIGTYASRGIYTYNGNAYNNNPGLGPLYAANPDLSWETSRILNIGIDFKALDFLSGTIEGYIKNNFNLLTSTSVSQTTGFTRSTQNLGNSQNKGIEFSLNANLIKRDEFNWEAGVNISFEKSIYTKLFQGNNRDLGSRIIREGESVNNFYLVRWAGVNPNNGDPLWYDIDGNITNEYDRDNRVVIGSSLPDFYGSFSNTFSYKGFNIRIYNTYTYGGLVYNSQRSQGETDGKDLGTYNQNKSQLNRWQNPGDITNVPKVVFQNESESAYTSTRFLESSSHLNIKNITLSYNFPKEFCSSLDISSLTISGMADNIFVFSGLKSLSSSSGKLSSYYPDVKTFLFSVSIGL